MSLTKVSYSMITASPINVADYGAVGDGVTDDSAAIQAALDAALPGQCVTLQGGKTYLCNSTIVLTGMYKSIISDSGMATLNLQNATIGLDVRGPYSGGTTTWMWALTDLRLVGTSQTLLRIGGGDTWAGRCDRCFIQGNVSTTENLVAITNNNVNAYRDYFITFYRCFFLDATHLMVIGGSFINQVYQGAYQSCNRIKITDCDFYGQTRYGIFIGHTYNDLDASNGHTIKGIHFDNAAAGAIADIYYQSFFNYVESCHESGAEYFINFRSASVGGTYIGSGLDVGSAISKIAISGVSSKSGLVELSTQMPSMQIILDSEVIGKMDYTQQKYALVNRSLPGREVGMTAVNGQVPFIGNYDPSTNTDFGRYFFGVTGLYSRTGSGVGTTTSFNVTRDTTTPLPNDDIVEVYLVTVTQNRGSNDNNVSLRLVTLYGPSAITDTSIVNQINGMAYGVTITRPSTNTINFAWTGFASVRANLLRIL